MDVVGDVPGGELDVRVYVRPTVVFRANARRARPSIRCTVTRVPTYIRSVRLRKKRIRNKTTLPRPNTPGKTYVKRTTRYTSGYYDRSSRVTGNVPRRLIVRSNRGPPLAERVRRKRAGGRCGSETFTKIREETTETGDRKTREKRNRRLVRAADNLRYNDGEKIHFVRIRSGTTKRCPRRNSLAIPKRRPRCCRRKRVRFRRPFRVEAKRVRATTKNERERSNTGVVV